jgi:hypothetical protein
MPTAEELNKLLEKKKINKVGLAAEKSNAEDYSTIGTMHSMFAGVGSGLISIPKGLFSLGATLMDLGAGTNKAAEVEKWFDDLTTWDERAEATTAGKITEALVNIGVPGSIAFTRGAALANTALRAKKLKKYFTVTDPDIVKAGKKAAELNAAGKTARFTAAATSGGIAEGVFIGDVEQIGTFGDLLGGPTELERDDDYDAARELINRVKFGTEGALFTGVLGGTTQTLKKLATEGKKLRFSNSKIDRLLDKIAAGFRARSGKTQEFFDIERKQLGVRSSDLNLAQQISRELDKNIDAVFPAWKTVIEKGTAKQRNKSLERIHDLLLSGKHEVDKTGKVIFGDMDSALQSSIRNELKGFGGKTKDINNIFKNLTTIRKGWGDMFTALGSKMDEKELAQFQKLFGDKFKGWLGGTYDKFQNHSLIPFLGYRASAEAVKNGIKMFRDIAKQNGKPITEEQAKYYVERLVKTAKLPKGFRMDRPSDPIFQVPDFFVGKTVLDDAVTDRGFASMSALPKEHRLVVEQLLGKRRNPMQTILGGTARLSLITRRNEFFQDLLKESDRLGTLKGGRKMFYENYDDAIRNLGEDIKPIKIDPGRTLEAGVTNPLDGQYAITEIAEALEETSKEMMSSKFGGKVYENLVLYPKAATQLAKTVLSPITHVRNFLSAGAFATANGIIPTPSALKTAYQALQIPLKGTRQQNDFYRELLELGVVNTNVRLGDLTRLLEDVNFGGTMSSDKGLRMLLKYPSKFKRFAQDMYTAEDDFWKIASYATEKERIGKAFINAGIKEGDKVKNYLGKEVKYGDDFLKNEAADIVRNNIPNYDYVSDFVKGLRKWPVGNFVSFPAEIMRTSTNIVRRGLRDINYTLPNGAKPLRRLGYQRLVGMGLTTAAVPAGVVAGAKMVYDVTEDEMEALRRYVADWSKNSTLVPIRDKETGDLKYIDFSHGNAYDLLARPFQTVLNSVGSGREDEDGIMDDFMLGMMNATKELALPFVDEAIWISAAADILARHGRTRDGAEVWNPEDTDGDKVYKMMSHLVKAAAPFSIPQFKRLGIAINEDFDKYGQSYGLGDELAGFTGFRVVNVNPARGLDFKIADYQRGVRNSRSLFTRATRLGAGPITPKEVIDAYINSNRALFEVRRNMMKDYEAGQILGLTTPQINLASRRLSKVDVNTIRRGVFRPLPVSQEVIRAFAENSRKMGVANPFNVARPVINTINRMLSLAPLSLEMFPPLYNPYDEEGMAEGGRVGYLAGGEVEDPEDEASAAAAWITEPEEIKEIFNHDFKQYFLSNIWKSKPKPPASAGTAGAQAKAPMDINTPKIDPSLLGKGPNTINNVEITRTGLTETENALLSNEEKAIRLRQRGIG